MTYQLFPEKLFMIQANNPGLIWKILLFYPLFSALFRFILVLLRELVHVITRKEPTKIIIVPNIANNFIKYLITLLCVLISSV